MIEKKTKKKTSVLGKEEKQRKKDEQQQVWTFYTRVSSAERKALLPRFTDTSKKGFVRREFTCCHILMTFRT